MHKDSHANMKLLEVAVERLGPLIDDVVFLRGCAAGLLLTDPAAPPVRVTRDVDVIVEVASLRDYQHFNQKFRNRGFSEDISPETPICRWRSGDIIFDVMPTDPGILGFGNRWFSRAFAAALKVTLPSGAKINVLPPPYFIATKIEAFHHRGSEDFLLSRDVEDVVAVFDGRKEIVSEVKHAEVELFRDIREHSHKWIGNRDFLDALPGLLPPDVANQDRVSIIMERIKSIIE